MVMMNSTLKLFWLEEHGWVLLPCLHGSLLNPVGIIIMVLLRMLVMYMVVMVILVMYMMMKLTSPRKMLP